MTESFPRQYARTQRFTLGAPRNLSVSADGARVTFLRSHGDDDPVNSLWVLDVATREERLVADPRRLRDASGGEGGSDLPPEERARRERSREGAGGITSYATDASGTVVAFALDGRLFVGGLLSGAVRPLEVDGPVFDPRPDPTAHRVAYVSGRALRIAELDGSSRAIAEGADEISWGVADFVAAEEMHRFRGYWWSPDGTAIAACRVDESPVGEWVIADPAAPDRPARTIRYPAAGTANAEVTLHVLGIDGSHTEVSWDRAELPYLAMVDWSTVGLEIQVQSRDQRRSVVFQVDPATGETVPMADDRDDAWVELVPGTPRRSDDGRLVRTVDRDGARRLVVGADVVTPADLQVRAVVGNGDAGITFHANPVGDATVVDVWRYETSGTLSRLTDGNGVHGAVVGGHTTVVRSTSLDRPGARFITDEGVEIRSLAATPAVSPVVDLFTAGDLGIATAVLLPTDHDGAQLPVLMDPYGGPHALRVTRSHDAFAASQWLADQGFAVVVADGRGTPGRGPEWERAVHGDLATAPLQDQITALHAAAERHPVLDLGRVAIRGWSFGGYLAALAVMRRPDTFHAAIAGAPVTEWRLYDTHYTERYLGDPAEEATAYDTSSLLPLAKDLERPLLLIHGLADDNVVAAHTLQLSSALLAAGRAHEVLPLVGVTHMTPQHVVAENLLRHQVSFLRRALAVS